MLAASEAASEPWIAELSAVLSRAIGRVPAVTGVPFGTDAGPLARAAGHGSNASSADTLGVGSWE